MRDTDEVESSLKYTSPAPDADKVFLASRDEFLHAVQVLNGFEKRRVEIALVHLNLAWLYLIQGMLLTAGLKITQPKDETRHLDLRGLIIPSEGHFSFPVKGRILDGKLNEIFNNAYYLLDHIVAKESDRPPAGGANLLILANVRNWIEHRAAINNSYLSQLLTPYIAANFLNYCDAVEQILRYAEEFVPHSPNKPRILFQLAINQPIFTLPEVTTCVCQDKAKIDCFCKSDDYCACNVVTNFVSSIKRSIRIPHYLDPQVSSNNDSRAYDQLTTNDKALGLAIRRDSKTLTEMLERIPNTDWRRYYINPGVAPADSVSSGTSMQISIPPEVKSSDELQAKIDQYVITPTVLGEVMQARLRAKMKTISDERFAYLAEVKLDGRFVNYYFIKQFLPKEQARNPQTRESNYRLRLIHSRTKKIDKYLYIALDGELKGSLSSEIVNSFISLPLEAVSEVLRAYARSKYPRNQR